jgi:chorismate dehydratase
VSDRVEPLRVSVPPLDDARALLGEWGRGAGAIVEGVSAPLDEAERLLKAGRTDVAFVPTLSILRDPDAFSVVPGVAIVGRAYPAPRLHLPAGLAPLAAGQTVTIGLNPRFAQEALLAQVIVKEAYGALPQFLPVPDGMAAPAGVDAYLLAADAPAVGGGVTLDLGQEWFELTTRPMVWALLAGTTGGIEPAEAQLLRDRTLALEGEPDAASIEEPASFTLAAYAHAGLEAWIHHLYYHRALTDLPVIPFVEIVEPGEGEKDDADDQ